MVVIIDYGLGNKASLVRLFQKLKVNAILSSKKDDILNASKLILPGVGHFNKGMQNLASLDLITVLNEAVIIKKIPILGICLGMQLMTSKSEEGNIEGLNWINAETKRFETDLKIPHVGWNTLTEIKNHSILKNLTEQDQFYFVHSYNITCKNKEDVLSYSCYGQEFVSSFQKENIFGTQFHPEKSHKQGLKIIKNFINV